VSVGAREAIFCAQSRKADVLMTFGLQIYGTGDNIHIGLRGHGRAALQLCCAARQASSPQAAHACVLLSSSQHPMLVFGLSTSVRNSRWPQLNESKTTL
jgi:hypothetical protein